MMSDPEIRFDNEADRRQPRRVYFANMRGEGVPRQWLENVLRIRLSTFGVRHRLDAGQLTKLHLAGRGDAKAFLRPVDRNARVEAVRHDRTMP